MSNTTFDNLGSKPESRTTRFVTSRHVRPPARPARRDTTGSRRPSLLYASLIAGASVAIGATLGALVTRQHYKAAQVVASVNGTVITDRQFHNRLEEEAGAPVLRQMVAEELKYEFAKTRGVAPTDAEVDTKYAEAARKPNFQEHLAASGQTPDLFRRRLRISLTEAAVIQKGEAATEAEMRQFYAKNIDRTNPKARYFTPESVRLAVIVTATESKARAALSELNNGSTFAAVATTYSIDPSKSSGGLLPTSYRGRSQASRQPGLEAAVFGMKIGQQIGPRMIIGHWWIIRCLDRKPESIAKYDKVRDECRTAVMLTKGLTSNAGKIQSDFAAFQQKASVHAFWPRYQNAINGK